MNETDLFSVLDRATDRIEPAAAPQHAAVSALARARVVRLRRRGVLAGAVAAAAVVAVVVATQAPGNDRTEPPVGPDPSEPAVVQAAWDPQGAADLPQRESVLPVAIELPSSPLELPLSGPARLAFADGLERIHLLESDGRWGWTQAPSGSAYTTSLSDDGTMLANLGNGKLFVTDVRYGGYEWREVPLPPGPAVYWSSPGTRLQWQGDTQLVLSSSGPGVVGVVDVDAGVSSALDLVDALQVFGYAVTPDGGGAAFAEGVDGLVIQDVEDDTVVRSVSAEALGRVWSPVANHTRVVGVVVGVPRADGPPEHPGLVVLDRDGYTATRYLPIAGKKYSPSIGNVVDPGGVSPVAWLDDHTVLLKQGSTLGKPWTLVAWDVETGELTHVSDGPDSLQLVSAPRNLVSD
ncbi:MAG: hypothetical protein WC642_12575 [Nocardioides sp.]|jgi:hypothetical protein